MKKINANDLLNKNFEEVSQLLDQAELIYRIVCKDHKRYMVTQDFKPERLNLTINDNVVTKITFG